MPQMDKTRKMVDLETFLRQRIDKVWGQVKKQKRDNREKEITQVMFGCLKGRTLFDLEMKDLLDLNFIIQLNLREVEIKQLAADKQKHEENQENQLKQVQADPIAVELGLTTKSAFGEETSKGVEQ
ncbi:hypothetical protein RchiOBHm_Chr7g0223301 [Rosa chinensis]|uniref:Uncharacterized protein n=1 Tax=Rosa chinensis TaxID=74649 RepID=A0A2P6PDI7_ROSCH|nr:hypothetical protein RchiOBHm_Chr7g0223301 [Rosa chinensis]